MSIGQVFIWDINVRSPPIADASSSRHTDDMRGRFEWIVFAFLTACGGHQPESGWEYRPDNGASSAKVVYNFGDGEGTELVGDCDGEPTFFLRGGAWQTGTSQFTVSVDGKSWVLPTFEGEHGHALFVERLEAQPAIANARHLIEFRVGAWRREIIPATPLEQFARECR